MEEKDKRVWLVANDMVEKIENWEAMEKKIKKFNVKNNKRGERKDIVEIKEKHEALKFKVEEMTTLGKGMAMKNSTSLHSI